MLFAEGDDIGLMAIVITIASSIGSAATWGLIQLTAWRKANRAEAKQDKDDTLAYWQDLVERQELDRKEAIAREEKCQERLNELTLNCGRMEEWIRHYEFHMKNQNVAYRSWKDTPAPAQLEAALRVESKISDGKQ